MKLWQTRILRVLLVLLAAVPAYCQRGTFGIDVGQTSDRFGTLPRSSGAEGLIDGEAIVLQSSDRSQAVDLVAGGEVRLPLDTGNHASEVAVYGGPAFRFGNNFTVGFHVQAHRIYLPTSTIDGAFFSRGRFSMLELPVVAEYRFGAAARHAFVRVEGGPEFTPRYHLPPTSTLPHPNLDHGYAARGVLGCVFGKWYLKGTYETRYFKFSPDTGNPRGLYNWRSDLISGGVGFAF
jgi:hypothetical protein